MSAKSRQKNMDIDYVIQFCFSGSDRQTSVARYENLIKALASVGLSTEVRNGDDQSLLIFVRPESEQDLFAEVYRSRTKDWLHGVRSAAPEKENEMATEKQSLYPAERLRIVFQLITNSAEEGGAGITPGHGEWKDVSVFPLHDHDFNDKMLKKWATQYTLKDEDLDSIRDMFGEKVAYYFAFTQFYFTTLVGIAAFGTSAYFLLGYFSPLYAIANGLTCIVFVAWWKSKEYDLSIRWGVRGVSSIECRRHDFRGEKEVIDVTGEKVSVFPTTKRLQRQLLQIPFALLATVALGSLIAFAFSVEIFMSEIYNGPGKAMLVFLPTGILTTIQPVVLGFLSKIAERLNQFENYETDLAYETALTQKIFILNFITSYLPISLTAFVYVPFAKELVPYLDVFSMTIEPFTEDSKQAAVPQPGTHFKINPHRLRTQMVYFVVTAQIINQATELVLPYLKQRGMAKYKDYKSKRAAKNGDPLHADPSADDPEEEKEFLHRVRREAELDVYNVQDDLREMIVQYGYLSLFGLIWPLTGVSFLINNWLELRTDAARICKESRRPTPWRADSIGPWLDSLSFLTWFGSLTSSAIAYMFSGSEHEEGHLGATGNREHIAGWALLLSMLASENVFFIVRSAVEHAISKIDTPGKSKERAERFSVRKRYLEESRGEQAARIAPLLKTKTFEEKELNRQNLEEEARNAVLAGNNAEKKFWSRQRSWQESATFGTTLIERSLTAQNKKGQ